MNSITTWQSTTHDPVSTEKLAEKIGQNLTGGEVIELVSDLGGGKTTFVRGLARGLGSMDHVSSPTFKISNEYQGQHLQLNHFDLYRLGEAGVIYNELAEVIDQPHSVLVIEWADIAKNALPIERLTITFTQTNKQARHLQFHYPHSLDYVMKGLN
ncbi:MAG TPA: tRNA (adenosine(37)-N6)-threonylcarbamoyltransferase complex ATPase subunit type 1 TsaE [Candidatus Saccharimonadales bacterium]|nr:tRNA (adenosine(37)-N6)-threonylcarbamoyltransferase complex ATPase subunit type 1 TsaE [Candidatus Saccharimonadales bacterium]